MPSAGGSPRRRMPPARELASGRDELARRRQRICRARSQGSRPRAPAGRRGVRRRRPRAGQRGDIGRWPAAEAAGRRAAARSAAKLAGSGLAPARPMRGDSALPPPDFAYSLPVDAPLTRRPGIGQRGRNCLARTEVRRRRAGAPVIAPADGKIVFAAPFRGQDGIVIIDHRRRLDQPAARRRQRQAAWIQGPPRRVARPGAGASRASNCDEMAQPVSPALIAASSVPLSNGGNSR